MLRTPVAAELVETRCWSWLTVNERSTSWPAGPRTDALVAMRPSVVRALAGVAPEPVAEAEPVGSRTSAVAWYSGGLSRS